VEESFHNVCDECSQENDQNYVDAMENEVKFEIMSNQDTLEILKATPLCTNAQDFERKYPPDLEMQPPNFTPIQNPNHTDILFGRGGLTNHHPGRLSNSCENYSCCACL
jgi:hypothetical protein